MTTQSSGRLEQQSQRLSIPWSRYWLSSLLGVAFTFVVYYMASGYLTHAARLKATLSKLIWMKVRKY